MAQARLKIKEVAEAKKMSMGRLSRLANITYNNLKAMYRNPYREISITTLARLATTLNVEPGDLLELVPDDVAEAEKEALRKQESLRKQKRSNEEDEEEDP